MRALALPLAWQAFVRDRMVHCVTALKPEQRRLSNAAAAATAASGGGGLSASHASAQVGLLLPQLWTAVLGVLGRAPPL